MAKRCCLLFWISFFCISVLKGQEYNVVSYNLNDTPVHGVKIKTNLPFINDVQMVSIGINGYSFDKQATIGLNLVYYIYDNTFYNASISSYGGDTPEVWLANENGKVVVFINDRVYYQRFTVKAFAQGIGETSAWFQGWTVVDEEMNGSASIKLAYKNQFAGDVTSENFYALGNVGIGTTSPNEKLSVNGNIRAKEIKVEATNWPDYVFENDYILPTLEDIEKQIKENGHLPGIPSAEEVKYNGIKLGEMNGLLLAKIEELTLHLIEKDKEVKYLLEQNETIVSDTFKRDEVIDGLLQRIKKIEKQNEK